MLGQPKVKNISASSVLGKFDICSVVIYEILPLEICGSILEHLPLLQIFFKKKKATKNGDTCLYLKF